MNNMRRGPSDNMKMERSADFKESIRKVATYGKRYMPAIVVAVVLSVVSSIFYLIGPNRLSAITDIILEGLNVGSIDLNAVSEIGMFLAAIYLTSFAFSYAQSFILSYVSQRLAKGLRSDITSKVDRLPLSYFDKRSHGDTLSLVTNDVDLLGTTLNQSLSSMISGMFMFFGALIMMLLTNVIMTLSALIATAVGLFLMMVIIKRSQKYFGRQQRELAKINGHIEEIYSSHTIVKAYGGEEKAKAEFSGMNKALRDSAWKSQFLSGLMQPIMIFIGNLSYVAVCIVGGLLAANGTISFGVIVAFTVYIRLFTQPLQTFAQSMTTLQSTAAAADRIFAFLAEEELPDEGDKTTVLTNVRGDISFKNVSFGYTKEKTIIENFSVDVKAGQKVAIVGPTGAGKTTIVNLLMRFYEISGGEITIDGISISDITRTNVRDILGMVLQDTWLFKGSVKENIIYSKEGVSDDDVIRVCKAVGIDHFISTLPKGYDSVYGEDFDLSAGQKQLLTIARAMIENADVLILDEATSSVDTRTEVLIQNAMDKLSTGKTSFIIAHRLSTIRNADLILVLKDGNIIEQGSHDELIEKKGFYSDLYNSQFESVSA